MQSNLVKILPLTVAALMTAASLAACADMGHTVSTTTNSTTRVDGEVVGTTTATTSSSVASDGTVVSSSTSVSSTNY